MANDDIWRLSATVLAKLTRSGELSATEAVQSAIDRMHALNPALNAMELLATVCDELGIGYDPGNHTLKSLTDSLHAYLLANYERDYSQTLLLPLRGLDADLLETAFGEPLDYAGAW